MRDTRALRGCILFVALFASVAQPVRAQRTVTGRAATLRFGGVIHGGFYASSVDDAASTFFVRRARLAVDATFDERLSGRLQTGFAGGNARVLDAYVRVNLDDAFQVRFGQFKRAFDLFELESSSDNSTIERDGRIPGFSACTGVGGVCSYSQLMGGLGLVNRDLGLRIDGRSGAVSWMASVTNGNGINTTDENDAKSVAARTSFQATEDVVVSANVTWKDYMDPLDETAYAFAWGGDVQVGTHRDGLRVQAGVAGGDNWRSLGPEMMPGSFSTAQVIVTYHHEHDGGRVTGLEPMLRFSVADPDDTIDDDGGVLVTPGVMLYFSGRDRIGLNWDYYTPASGDPAWVVRLQSYLYF